MKIGIVGYQGSGKSTLFEWLTGVTPDPSLSHTLQSGMATIPEDRVAPLCEVYHPKKITLASLELVDTPGLSRTHEGNAVRLGHIRDTDCLIVVVAAFDGTDPRGDLAGFQEDLLLTDLEIVSGRIERLRASIKKPRPDRKEQEAELAALLPIQEMLEAETPLRDLDLSDEQRKFVRAFQLMTEKPQLILVNLADDETDPSQFVPADEGGPQTVAVPLGLELELARMSEEDRNEFRREMGLESFDRDGLIRTIMDASGQMLFFTAGEKEVRTWILRKGGTAVEAAGGIHTDMARGFIRAEAMCAEDLIRLGSEREVKAQHLVRHEPKDYVVQDGDILLMRFSV